MEKRRQFRRNRAHFENDGLRLNVCEHSAVTQVNCAYGVVICKRRKQHVTAVNEAGERFLDSKSIFSEGKCCRSAAIPSPNVPALGIQSAKKAAAHQAEPNESQFCV